jgi:hypothetical protein
MGQPKKKPGFGDSDLIYFRPEDFESSQDAEKREKILQFPALIKHPQLTNFCEVLIHRYLTKGERSWLFLGDGPDSNRHLQLLIAAITQNLLLQVFEKIAIVMLDETSTDYISKFFYNYPNPEKFPAENGSDNLISSLPDSEKMSLFEKQQRVAFWPVSRQLQNTTTSIAASRENFSNLANSFDFIIVFSSTFGEEEKSYSDPVRLQAVWNVDRAYFMTEVGSSRATNIKRQMELVKFLGLKLGEGLLWKPKWLEQASNALFGADPAQKEESLLNKILRFKK